MQLEATEGGGGGGVVFSQPTLTQQPNSNVSTDSVVARGDGCEGRGQLGSKVTECMELRWSTYPRNSHQGDLSRNPGHRKMADTCITASACTTSLEQRPAVCVWVLPWVAVLGSPTSPPIGTRSTDLAWPYLHRRLRQERDPLPPRASRSQLPSPRGQLHPLRRPHPPYSWSRCVRTIHLGSTRPPPRLIPAVCG